MAEVRRGLRAAPPLLATAALLFAVCCALYAVTGRMTLAVVFAGATALEAIASWLAWRKLGRARRGE